MSHYWLGLVCLATGYVIGQVRGTMSAFETLRRLIDASWSRWLETSDPEDYETFCRLRDRLQAAEEHGGGL